MIHVTWGIVIACGKAEEISAEVYASFLSLGAKPVLAYSLAAMEQCPDVSGVVVVVSKDRVETVLGMSQMYGFAKVQKVVPCSGQRQSAVVAGLRALDDEVSMVVVHDASRPCVTPAMISETVKAAKRYGSGVSATPIVDTIKEVSKGLTVSRTLRDGALWAVQTPQAFKRETIEKAYAAASKRRFPVEEDSSALDFLRVDVHLVEGSPANIRIRSVNDFNVAANLLKV